MKHITSYKVPKSVEFVDSLPKNPQGKIFKKTIRSKCRKPNASDFVFSASPQIAEKSEFMIPNFSFGREDKK
jgi:hypothetical protein